MNPQEEQLARLEQKIDAIYTSTEKTRKYIKTMLIVTLITIVLPLILAVVFVPIVMSMFGDLYSI